MKFNLDIPSAGTMKAAILQQKAGNLDDAFKIVNDYPKPSIPSPPLDWVLVRVKAFGLNRAELRARDGNEAAKVEFGLFKDHWYEGISPPEILGEEFVGFVEDPGSSDLQKGDIVAGCKYGGGKAYNGSYAQYTLCLRRLLWKLETKLRWDVLGAIPMSFETAYGSMFWSCQCKPNQTLLIHGGTSSVGTAALALAKHYGINVITTTRSSNKVQRLKNLGAENIIVEDSPDKLSQVMSMYNLNGVENILELVGPKHMKKTIKHLSRGGYVVVTGVLDKDWSIDFSPAEDIPSGTYVTMYGAHPEHIDYEAKMQEIFMLVEDGKLNPSIDSVFKLDDIVLAHKRQGK